MRKLGIASLLLLVMVVSACSTPQGGDVAAAHAKDRGFEVIGVGDDHAVVRIGKSCTGVFEAWDLGNGDEINSVYNKVNEEIWGWNDTDATDPNQFKNFPRTAGCYD